MAWSQRFVFTEYRIHRADRDARVGGIWFLLRGFTISYEDDQDEKGCFGWLLDLLNIAKPCQLWLMKSSKTTLPQPEF